MAVRKSWLSVRVTLGTQELPGGKVGWVECVSRGFIPNNCLGPDQYLLPGLSLGSGHRPVPTKASFQYLFMEQLKAHDHEVFFDGLVRINPYSFQLPHHLTHKLIIILNILS